MGIRRVACCTASGMPSVVVLGMTKKRCVANDTAAATTARVSTTARCEPSWPSTPLSARPAPNSWARSNSATWSASIDPTAEPAATSEIKWYSANQTGSCTSTGRHPSLETPCSADRARLSSIMARTLSGSVRPL